MSRWWNARWSKNIWWRATTGTTRTTRAWRVKSSWNRRARELSPAAVGNWDRGALNHGYGRSIGRVPGMWAGQDLITHRAQFLAVWVVSLCAADNDYRPRPPPLRGVHQPVVRASNEFAIPH